MKLSERCKYIIRTIVHFMSKLLDLYPMPDTNIQINYKVVKLNHTLKMKYKFASSRFSRLIKFVSANKRRF